MVEPGHTREDSVFSGPKIKRSLNIFGNQRTLNCISLLLDKDKIVGNGAEISVQ